MATPLILKRDSRSSGQWRDDDYDVLESGVVVRPHFQGVDCTCGQAVDVGERPLGGHGQARRTRLRAVRPHFAKYAVRGKAVDVAKLAYRGRIDSRITD
jgi:hypothetical protein